MSTVCDFWRSTFDKLFRRIIESTKTRRTTKMTYEFVARGTSGQAKLETVCGTVRAPNLPEAKRTIQRRGLYLISIELLTASAPYTQASRSILKRVKEFFLSIRINPLERFGMKTA